MDLITTRRFFFRDNKCELTTVSPHEMNVSGGIYPPVVAKCIIRTGVSEKSVSS
jgi:hypothetical protein